MPYSPDKTSCGVRWMFDDSPECRDQWCEFASTTSEHVLVGDKLRRALRVLNALVVRGHADPSDVAELRRVAPLLASVPVEELASGVLEQVLKDQSLVRSEPCQPKGAMA
jgi:hypothetical protein